MRFSANPGRKPEPLKNVASGGELSRLMLSIKKLSAAQGRTIILDEIDTGVSGEVAHSMGKIMREMGVNQQVISITHLPQIASKGKTHFKVFKEESDKNTKTRIERLDEKERVVEIAQMLSGAETTAAAMDNARDLLLAN
jgi:DNA repair protein RecN (Recombination protein N)